MKAEERAQEAIHGALAEALPLADGHVLTGWVVCFESHGPDDYAEAGHYYGPRGMTTWKALGLVEWVGRRTIPEGYDEDDEDDD